MRLQRFEIGTIALARVPAEHAGRVGGDQRPGRIDDPVADRPDDGGVEQPQPPARQRRVQLADAVPFVAGGGGAGDAVDSRLSLASSAMTSVLPQRHARGFVELLLARGPQRVDQHDQEDHDEVDEAPGLGEVARAPDRSRTSVVSSADVGFVVVELEVDLRAEHLQIGDQRIGLGDAAGIAVEVARLRLGVALRKIGRVRDVGGRLRPQVGDARWRSSRACRARRARACTFRSSAMCANSRARSRRARDRPA